MPRESAFISKVLVPRRSGNRIRRKALLARLGDDDHPVVSIVAPAGYGKTTTLTDFAHEANAEVSWLALDEWDRDPVEFLMYLRTSLVGTTARTARFNASTNTEDLHSMLGEIVLEATESADNRILVVDDVHHVEDCEPIVELINYLAQHLPPGLKLMLTSRHPMPLQSTAKLRLDDRISEYGPADLSFSADEISELLRLRGREPGEGIEERLLAITGGWPAGVALSGDASTLVEEGAASAAVAEYLSAEVLRDIPKSLRRFLDRTSVLDVLDPEACDALVDEGGALESLRSLTKSNIPLTESGGRRLEIRIHPLVRDFLRSELKSHDATLYRSLHRRAAERAEGIGQQSDAVSHYIVGEDWDSVARTICEQAPKLYSLGRWHTVAAWIRAIPPDRLIDYPALRWWEARLLARLGEIDGALRVISEAGARADKPVQAAEFATLKALALRAKGDVSGAVESARQAVELAVDNNAPIDVVAEARKEYGLALMAEGSLAASAEEFQAVLALQDRRGRTAEAAGINGCLGSALGMMGRLAEAAEHMERARKQWQIVGNVKELCWVLNNLGMIYSRIGQVQLAIDVFDQCVSKSRQSENRRPETYALLSLAEIERDAGEARSAMEKCQSAYDIAAELGDQTALVHARCGLASCHGLLGDPKRGITLARQALASARERASAFEEGVALCCLGRLLRRADSSEDEAVSVLSQAVSLFEQTSSNYELAQTLLYLADAALPHRGSRGLVKVSLERFAVVAETLGESAYHLVPAADLRGVIEFGMSRKLGGGIFREVLRRDTRGLEDGREPSSEAAKLPAIRVRALGTLEVQVGERQVLNVEWESEKAREMFLLLVMEHRPLTRDEVVAYLWPETGGSKASSLFHSTLHRLRRALYKEVVKEDGGRYRISPEVSVTSDVDEFRAGVDRQEDTTELREALSLYAGPFAPSLESDWADTLRATLEETFLQAAQRLAELSTTFGDNVTAVRTCERILDIDPFNETACLLLMRAHANSGDVESALRSFKRFSETLELELGELPGSSLMELHKELEVSGRRTRSLS